MFSWVFFFALSYFSWLSDFPPQYQNEWTAVPRLREHLVRQTALRWSWEVLLRGSQRTVFTGRTRTHFVKITKKNRFLKPDWFLCSSRANVFLLLSAPCLLCINLIIHRNKDILFFRQPLFPILLLSLAAVFWSSFWPLPCHHPSSCCPVSQPSVARSSCVHESLSHSI